MAEGGGGGGVIGGKCTFGVRMPIEIHMLNEKIYREVKNFRNYTIYTPSFGETPVASKFYAKHDQFVDEGPQQAEKTEQYHRNVAQTRAKGPRSKYPRPATENMGYGWHITPFVKYDRNDRRFYHPRQDSHHTKVEIIISMANPKKEDK